MVHTLARALSSCALGFVFIASSVSGCGTSGSTPTTCDGSCTEQRIGPQGGSVTSADGKVTLEVPKDALSADVTITVRPIANPPDGATLAYEIGPNGTEFTTPARLRLNVTVDRPDPALAVWMEDRWVPLPMAQSDVPTGLVLHLTPYGVVFPFERLLGIVPVGQCLDEAWIWRRECLSGQPIDWCGEPPPVTASIWWSCGRCPANYVDTGRSIESDNCKEFLGSCSAQGTKPAPMKVCALQCNPVLCPKPCDAQTCANGCCDSGFCRSGTHWAFCGNQGNACTECRSLPFCDPQRRVCVSQLDSCNGASCGGCCDALGRCHPGNTDDACGKGGALCRTCAGSSCDSTTHACTKCVCPPAPTKDVAAFLAAPCGADCGTQPTRAAVEAQQACGYGETIIEGIGRHWYCVCRSNAWSCTTEDTPPM